MSLGNGKDYILFELEYKASTKGETKIFDESFVNKNKDKCKIIYKKQEYELTENFEDIDNNHNNLIKFQIRINNNIKDISCMFYECKSLLSIRDIKELDGSNIINESLNDYNSNISNEKSNNLNNTEKSEILHGLSDIRLKQSTFDSIGTN